MGGEHLRTYSDEDCLVEQNEFVAGAPIFINNKSCSLLAKTGCVVKVRAYTDANVLVDTALDTTFNYPENVVQDLKTNIGSGTAPSFDSTGWAAGKYYADFYLNDGTLSGSERESFTIVDAPCITSPVTGDTWGCGEEHDITWDETVFDPSALLTLTISFDNGGEYQTIEEDVPNTGTFAWLLFGVDETSGECLIQITDGVTTYTSELFTLLKKNDDLY